jgi:hypothetical protein
MNSDRSAVSLSAISCNLGPAHMADSLLPCQINAIK